MDQKIKAILDILGFDGLMPMQQECVEKFPKAQDLLLYAPTGSGKTLGFLLPIVQDLDVTLKHTQALIITPTRELGLQIEQVVKSLKQDIRVVCLYGGHPIREELRSMESTPQIIIGTPGRLIDHLERQSISLVKTRTLVLDEFDKSLEFGFQEELAYLIDQANCDTRVFCSATELDEFPDFVKLRKVSEVNFLVRANHKVDRFKKTYPEEEKVESLMDVLCTLRGKTLVFCNHREATERLAEHLNEQGIPAIAFHGKLEQEERERRLIQFRNGSRDYLIATDLAARGLDIEEVETVIHYQLPVTEQTLIHRNGRVGRMEQKGTIVTLFSEEKPDQKNEYLQAIQEWKELPIPKNLTLPVAPQWETIYFSGGKKEKINVIDIVGFLGKNIGLAKDEIGKIMVLDHTSYAAIARDKVNYTVKMAKTEKVKGKKLKIAVAR